MLSLKNKIIQSFYFNGSCSAADIARSTKKSIPNITKIINELVKENTLIEEGYGPSTGGRRAAKFALNSTQNPYFIIVAIDQFSIKSALFDINNVPIVNAKTTYSFLAGKDAFNNIVQAVKDVLDQVNFEKSKIAGIGITIPGFVDSTIGINDSFLSSELLYNLAENLEKVFHIKCFIENDSSAIAIAESNFGIAKNINNSLVINWNWGVGLGIVVEGKLFTGHNGFAGEFSHIPLSQFNKMCSCGKRGCLEVEASLSTAVEYVENKLRSGESSVLEGQFDVEKLYQGKELISAALNGDPLAINAVNNSAYMLGKGIATLIHILNPEKIIISGRGAELGAIILPQIQSAVYEFAIPRLAAQTKIEVSNLSQDIQLLGAMCLAIERYLRD